jgi:dipeptidyl aminopeptidase/acylaminoacyl peptidase
MPSRLAYATIAAITLSGAIPARAQGTAADYARANGLRAKYEGLVVNLPGPATWIDKSDRFWYRRMVKGGSEFIIVDAETQQKRPAFDHEKIAAALTKATGTSYTTLTLPFNTIAFVDNERTLEVTVGGAAWRCGLADYDCRKTDPNRRGGRGLGPPRRPEDTAPRVSPDQNWEALINNYNVVIRAPGTQKITPLKKYRFDVGDGKEVVWMSERDGWNHLYLLDGASGAVRNQITKGAWPVRSVVKVDEPTRQIWFSANGMYPGKDPYFAYYYRINFDGTGLTRLTGDADANHVAAFSSDGKYFVDTYSRIDLAPVSELRLASDGSLVAEIERGDISALAAAGWRAPEPFVAAGRDGKTEIYGVIVRPSNFDPAKKYPVIENIYAGPQGSFVPNSFAAFNPMMAQADLGFIVVQIDGMGTANRSKTFHDVAWKNLGDAGFPDRILWHKAAAAKFPWYDTSRVGIYGTSAGGQNSLGGMLFHPEFYTAAVSAAGCHDNRMDKIWWNEQWMGWPLGPQYSASSNVDNANRLQGHVLLVVGELDTNVDPSSTMQVVNQLIKHDKDFDLLYIPGAGHGAGGAYGEHKRFDFFVRHLLGMKAPDWTDRDRKASTQDQDEDQDRP